MDSPHLLSLADGALCDNVKWSEHRGGRCPVASHQMVEIKHRAGSTHICPAGALSWGHGEFINEILDTAPDSDIVAYRLVNITKLNTALAMVADIAGPARRSAIRNLAPTNSPAKWRRGQMDRSATKEQMAMLDRIREQHWPDFDSAVLAAVIETTEADARIADMYAHMVAGKEIAASIRSGIHLENSHD